MTRKIEAEWKKALGPSLSKGHPNELLWFNKCT
jgi:hypothetical protein